MNIALLGAESSGKSTLAQALVRELQALQDRQVLPHPASPVCGAKTSTHARTATGQAKSGPEPTSGTGMGMGPDTVATRPTLLVHAVAVPETLRSWCEAQGRTPLAHEQAHIAHTQHRQIQAARAQLGPHGWLVADTTPLMTAVYSEHYWGDDSLTPWALGVQQTFDLTLLMGLDLPWQADGPWRDGPAVQHAVDSRLRAHLLRTGTPFQTVFGTGTQRVAAALQAIGTALSRPYVPNVAWIEKIKKRADNLIPASAKGQFRSKYWAACEACSDPDCEHTLFTQLMAQRAPAP